ncbi:MAG: archease [Anaerolinea sp.]|nr:archease [Anaerolinea sp.]
MSANAVSTARGESGSFTYFAHDADIGIVGRGPAIESAFEQAARAMFAIMASLEQVRPVEAIEVAFDEADVELALVTWLNLILAETRSRGMVAAAFQVSQQGSRWLGRGSGERWRAGLDRGVEVKGATLTMLSVSERDGVWEARCVVDV